MIIIINGPLGIGKTQTSWALVRRSRELVDILNRAALTGDLGTPLDTTSLTAEQAADAILQRISGAAHASTSIVPNSM